MRKLAKLGICAASGFSEFGIIFLGGLLSLSWGCGPRTLTVHQESRINTAMHLGRPREKQTGEPLEVNVVCVYPGDLEKPENERLKPDSGITSKEWYDFRPTGGPPDGSHFNLPANQIYLLTNEEAPCGKVKGPALRGALEDGFAERTVKGIAFKKKAYSKNSIIYVFPKFIDRSGDVLPVEPVKFRRPGKQPSNLHVRIGVKPGGPHDGQYIEKAE